MNNNDFFDEIKAIFPDAQKVEIQFDCVLANNEIQGKGLLFAETYHTQLLRFERKRLEATFIFSEICKKSLDNVHVGSPVKFIPRDYSGKTLVEFTRTGKVVDNCVYFICGDACMKVDFGDGPDMYGILSLEFEKGGDK